MVASDSLAASVVVKIFFLISNRSNIQKSKYKKPKKKWAT